MPSDKNRHDLYGEISRVVVSLGQRHHKDLKRYFIDPRSEGAYLVADRYEAYIASFAENGVLDAPEHYKKISRQKRSELCAFIKSLNQAAGRVVCDREKLYFQDAENLTDHERRAILATHTGNLSKYSFAAEVEYHARFLTAWASIKIPMCKKSVYDSAVRADMTLSMSFSVSPLVVVIASRRHASSVRVVRV